ncbi:MAG TPA: queuosine salvage family protein [Chloroflexota bacterium]|nr:queuosine salvage family protein [Chloroflexota bacterium]
MPTLFDEVRTSCAAVAARARHVAIAYDVLPRYAASLPLAQLATPPLDPRYHLLADEARTAAYFLTLETINFGSGYFPAMRKRPGLSGYFTVALALKEAFEREGPWSAAELAAMTPERCAAVFGQAPDFPLMALFATALRDLGQLLLERYDGQPLALVAAAGTSAERLACLLLAMPYYRDVADYDGLRVAFYKRAQLAAADLALAFAAIRSPRAQFTDLDQLTSFADNLVPHVLRIDGVLRYAPALLARIEAGEPLPAGSPEEIEIRACAVHAVELLKAEVARLGGTVTAAQLDYYLWNRGQAPAYKARPRHRTPTVYY